MSGGKNHRANEAYRRTVQRPNATPFHGTKDDVTIIRCTGTNYVLGDWVCINSGSGGIPTASTPDAANDKNCVGVVVGSTSTELRVQVTGVCAAKVAASLSAGTALGTASGSTIAQEYDASGDGAICGKLLYYFTSASDLALVQIDTAYSKLDYDRMKIHHHSDGLNTRWVDTTYGVDTGYSWHLFRVYNIQQTGTEDKLCLAISGGDDGKPGSHENEGYAWGAVIGFRDVMSAGQIGGDATFEQGVWGIEESIATAGGPSRVNNRTFGGWNSRDRDLSNGQVGPIRFQRGDHSPDWPGTPSITIDVPPPIAPTFKWWSGAMIWDSGANCSSELHDGVAASWGGQWAPSVAAELNCEYYAGFHDCAELDLDCCSTDPISNRTQFKTNGEYLNGPVENVIPWAYVVTAGRIDELSLLNCHSKHIAQLWFFLEDFTAKYWIWADALCTALKNKADLPNQTQGPCPEPVAVPVVNCGPNNAVDCDGTPITPP